MSREIDEKVVALRFDNSRFEKNVQQSMSTLEKLKAKLDFSKAAKNAEGINDAIGRCDITPLGDAADKVKLRFSALEVVAVTALANITNKAVNAGERMIKSLSLDQVTAGWTKYGQKTASVQTIMNATGKSIEEVNGYLDKLMWFSDETSFGFTDMTAALSTMTSAGGNIEKLIPMIEGIANATAYAGKGASEFSRVIYNLNQSYGQGFLSLMDWKSVSNASVDSKALKQTIIDTAVAMGKLKKNSDGTARTLKGTLVTAGTFQTTLEQKWADTKVMEEAFSKFAEMTEKAYEMVKKGEAETATEAYEKLSGQFGEIAERAAKAGQEAKTFAEAIDATKDAVSSKWMATFELIFGNYEKAKKLWSDVAESLYEIFAAGGDDRNAALKKALNSPWEQLSERVKDAGGDIERFQKELIEAGKAAGTVNDELIESAGGFEESLKSGWLTNDLILGVLDKMSDKQKKYAATTEEMTKTLEYFQTVVDKVWHGDYKNGKERIEALTKAGYNYREVQDLVNKTVDHHRLTLDDLTDEQKKAVGMTEEQIAVFNELAQEARETDTDLGKLIQDMSRPAGRDLLADSITTFLGSMAKLRKSISDAKYEILGDGSSMLYKAIELLNKLTKRLEITDEKADKLKRTFSGFFSVIKLGGNVISSVFAPLLNFLKGQFDLSNFSVLDLTASIGDFLTELYKVVQEKNSIGRGLTFIFDKFSNGIDKLKKFKISFTGLNTVMAPVEKLFTNLGNRAKTFFSNIDLPQFGNSFGFVSTAISKLRENLDKLKGISAENAIGKFLENLKGVGSDLGTQFDELKAKIIDFADNTDKYLSAAWATATRVYNNFVSVLKKVRAYFDAHIGIGELLAIGMITATILAVDKLAAALDKLSKLATFPKLMNSINGVLSTLKLTLNDYRHTLQAKTFLEIAEGIGVLSASLLVLALVPDDKVLKSIGLLYALAVSIGVFTYSINALGGSLNLIAALGSLSVAMITFAGSVLILSAAFEKISKLDSTNVLVATGGLTLMVLFLARIGSIDMLGGVAKAIPTFAGALKAAGAILLLVSAFTLILTALAHMPEMDWEYVKARFAGFVSAIGALVIVAGVMTGATLAFKKLQLQLITFSGSILAMSAAMLLLLAFVKLAGAVKKEDILKTWTALAAMSPLLIAFIALMAFSNLAGQHASKAGSMILKMSIAMTLLTGMILMLSSLSVGKIAKATIAVSAMMIAFGICIKASGAAADAKYAIAAMMVAVLSMGLLVAALTFVDWQKLIAPTIAMGALMLALAFVFVMASTIKADAKTAATFAIIGVTIGVLGLSLTALAKYPWQQSLAAAGSLGLVLLAVLACLTTIQVMTPMAWAGIIGLAAIGVVVFGLSAILKGLASTSSADNLKNATALSELLVVMSVSLLILGGVGAMLPAVIAGGVALAVAIVIVGLAMYKLGALMDECPELKDKIDKGCEILSSVLSNFGKALASFIDGLLLGATENLDTISERLGRFVDVFRDAPPDLKETATGVLGALKELMAVSNVTSESDQMSANLTAVTEGYSTLIDKLRDIGNAEDIDSSVKQINAICTALGALGSLSGDGLGTWFSGDFKIEDVGAVFENLGKGFSSFYDAVKDITAEKVAFVIDELKKLSELGGMKFDGIVSLTGAMQQLAQNGLKSFTDEFEGSSDKIRDSITKTIELAKKKCMNVVNKGKGAELGRYFMDGLVDGMKQREDTVCQTAYDIGTKLLEKFEESTQIGSPSKAMKRDGGFLMAGLVNGIKSNAGKVYNAVDDLGGGILSTFAERLGIHSPSTEAYEQGLNVIRGYVNSITENGGSFFSSIGNLAQTGLDKFSGLIKTDKNKNVLNGWISELSNIFKTDTLMSDASKLLAGNVMGSFAAGLAADDKAEKAATEKAQAIVNAFKEELDKADLNKTTNDLEYKLYTALNGEDNNAKLNNLQKNLAEQKRKVELSQSEYELTMATFGKESQKTQEAYNKLLQQQIDLADINKQINEITQTTTASNRDALKNYSQWMIEFSAKLQEQGFTLAEIEKMGQQKFGFDPSKPVIDTNMEQVVEQAIGGAVSTVQTVYAKTAENTFSSLVADGAVENMVGTTALAIESHADDWYRAGQTMADKLIEGIKSRMAEMRTLGDTLTEALLSSITGGSANDTLTIKPVVDLSNVKEGGNKLSDLIDRMSGIDISGVRAQISATEMLRAAREQRANASEKSSTVNNYNFTQNNTSPKALDEATIYRHSKTLIGKAEQSAQINEGGVIYAV